MLQLIEIMFAVNAALLFYVYVGYPLLVGALSLLRPGPQSTAGCEPMHKGKT